MGCTDLYRQADFGRDAAARLGLFLDLQVLPVRGRGEDGTGRLGLQCGTKLVQEHLQLMGEGRKKTRKKKPR